MSHNSEAKALQKLLQERESEHKDCLMILVNHLDILRSGITEASVFVQQGNNGEAAHALSQVYYDCQKLCDHITNIATGNPICERE